MELPWSHGFLAAVLGDAPIVPVPALEALDEVPLPLVDEPEPEEPVTALEPEPTVRQDKMTKRLALFSLGTDAKAVEGAARDAVLAGWSELLLLRPGASSVGLQLSASNETVAPTLALVTADRRTSTLKARLGSLALYARWCRMAGAEPFPFCEDVAFRYVLDLLQNRAPATRAARFREAVGFAKGVFGFSGADSVLESRRIQGAAVASFDTKRLLVKREPLKKAWLEIFEYLCVSAPDDLVSVFAGFVCLLCHCRARWADAQTAVEEPTIDEAKGGEHGGFIEVRIEKTKTSGAKRARRKALFIVGCSKGVSGEMWAKAWLEARARLGLHVAAGLPLMPAPLAFGCWTQRPMTTSEGALWMREILVDYGVAADDLKSIGAHSLKATLLSWAAKAGLSMSDRRLLGYHVAPRDRSVVEYSRDEMAAPLRSLQKLLSAVRSGEFMPDETRSGRWADGAAGLQLELAAKRSRVASPVAPPDAVAPATGVAEADQEADAASSTSGSATGSTSSGDVSSEPPSSDQEGPCSVASFSRTSCMRAPSRFVDDRVLVHKCIGTVHKGRHDDPDRLACGRLVGLSFTETNDIPTTASKRCIVCFGTVNAAPEAAATPAPTRDVASVDGAFVAASAPAASSASVGDAAALSSSGVAISATAAPSAETVSAPALDG
jgi:hypothetical protein